MHTKGTLTSTEVQWDAAVFIPFSYLLYSINIAKGYIIDCNGPLMAYWCFTPELDMISVTEQM